MSNQASIGDTRIIKIRKPNQPDEFAIQLYRSRLPSIYDRDQDQAPGKPEWVTCGCSDLVTNDLESARIALAFWRKHGSWTAVEVIGEDATGIG